MLIAAVAALALATPAAAQEMALTFDDLPAHNALPPGETRLGVIARLVAALADAAAPPTMGFINAASIEETPGDRAVLEVWRAAGNPLGNHTWSHANLDAVGAEGFEAEVARNEPMLRALAGDTDWHWFRYPYLSEGQDPALRRAARETLRERGYKVASVTMDFSDWAFNEPYARCRTVGDAAGVARLEILYLTVAEDALAWSRSLSNTLYGRDIPYVLLMHVGALDAHMLPRLLEMYRARGVRFVTLETAMADPFYDADRKTEASPAALTLENAAAAAGVTPPARIDVQAELAALCR
jgi:peptidoglycan/xylan/chitin deacetylase (PgdA/CDA1 family)